MAVCVLLTTVLLSSTAGQQLLYASPSTVPIEFPAAVVFIPVSGRSDALDSTDETGDYALMAWIIQFQVSVSGFTFFGLHTNEVPNIALSRQTTGEYVVGVFDYWGNRSDLTVQGVIGRWEHIAIGVCSNSEPYTLTVCRTGWLETGTQCESLMVRTKPVLYSPDFTRIDMGDSAAGLMYGMFTDITIYTNGCIGSNMIHAQVAAFACAPECNSACLGPSFYFCTSYSQLFRPDNSYYSQFRSNIFPLSDVNFPHRSPLGPYLAFSGWYRSDMSPFTPENLFKLENSRCYMPVNPGDGCQVLGIYHDMSDFTLYIEDLNGVVVSATIPDVRFT